MVRPRSGTGTLGAADPTVTPANPTATPRTRPTSARCPGAGENLSEHVVGRGRPPVDVRHDMLAEAVEMMRELWTGDWVTYHGEHLTAQDAKLFSLPEEPPAIAIAASGPRSIRLAVEHGDGIVCDSPDPDVVQGFKDEADGLAWTQLPVAYDPDPDTALDAAHHFAFGAPGWKVMAELPNVPGFDAVADLVGDDTIRGLVATGSDPGPLVDRITQAVESGYDRVSVVQVGPDRTQGFQRWWTEQVAPRLP